MHQQVEQDISLHPVSANSISPAHTCDSIDQISDQTSPADEQDGGLRGWLQVLGSFMIFVNIWGFTFIFGIFQSFYELSYLPGESASSISWIGTIQSSLLVIIGVVAGPLYDLGVYRLMMITGSALILLGLFTLSVSTQYYQVFLSQGIAVGVGGGLLYVPSLALVSGAFKKRRAIAMGVVTCGIGLGGVIYVAAFQSLLPVLGFPWTVRVIAFIALAVFAIAIPTLILNTPTSIHRSQGNKTRSLWDTAALRDAPFLAYSLSSFLIFLGYLVPFFYIPSFAQITLHTTRSASFWCLAISSATSIAGRLASALLAQKLLGTMLTWVLSGAISSLLCFTWIAITRSFSAFTAFCALYGFFSGGLVALPATVFPRICRDPRLLGTWMGMGWSMSGLAFLVGAPIAGALATVGVTAGKGDGEDGERINFLPVQVWSGVLLALGSLGLCTLWALLVKLRGEKLLV